jgi:hypothetical protein
MQAPDPTTPYEAGDIVYLGGTSAAIRSALAWFEPEGSRSEPPDAEA